MRPDEVVVENEQVHHVLVVVEGLGEPVGLATIAPVPHPHRQVEPLDKRGAGLVGNMLAKDLPVLEVEVLGSVGLDQLEVFDAPAKVAPDRLGIGLVAVGTDSQLLAVTQP